MVYDTSHGTVRCLLAWAPHADATWRWVAGNESSSTSEIIGLGPRGAFDSHICFAAASPSAWGGSERLYYFGGNGPHSGERNSLLGVATLRKDGYAGVRGAGHVELAPVLCTAHRLLVTWDASGPTSALRIGLAHPEESEAGLALNRSVPLERSVTDAAVAFSGGIDFRALRGRNVTLAVELRGDGGTLYTVGFG